MPNFTTPLPPKLTGKAEEDVKLLKRWGSALIDELTYIFNNLDSGNVIEASSVKAENIKTVNAKISNAQIGGLTADKLVSGTIDTSLVKVEDDDGNLSISGSEIRISDEHGERFVAAYDKDEDEFKFELYNADGEKTVGINSNGDAVFSGVAESSTIFSSTIVGTDRESFNEKDGDVFANIDRTGIKVMQDKNGERLQKVGMSVADNGTAYFVLGAGNGNSETNINGVVYTDGTFTVEKNDAYARMGLVGYEPSVTFFENNEELWLNGNVVYINNRDILSEINEINDKVNYLLMMRGEEI